MEIGIARLPKRGPLRLEVGARGVVRERLGRGDAGWSTWSDGVYVGRALGGAEAGGEGVEARRLRRAARERELRGMLHGNVEQKRRRQALLGEVRSVLATGRDGWIRYEEDWERLRSALRELSQDPKLVAAHKTRLQAAARAAVVAGAAPGVAEDLARTALQPSAASAVAPDPFHPPLAPTALQPSRGPVFVPSERRRRDRARRNAVASAKRRAAHREKSRFEAAREALGRLRRRQAELEALAGIGAEHTRKSHAKRQSYSSATARTSSDTRRTSNDVGDIHRTSSGVCDAHRTSSDVCDAHRPSSVSSDTHRPSTVFRDTHRPSTVFRDTHRPSSTYGDPRVLLRSHSSPHCPISASHPPSPAAFAFPRAVARPDCVPRTGSLARAHHDVPDTLALHALSKSDPPLAAALCQHYRDQLKATIRS